MPSAPEFIEAGFLTPSAFAASQAAADQITATATVAGSGSGPILADSSPAGGIGALSALDQGGAASGGAGAVNLTTRAPLAQSPASGAGGFSAATVALLPLFATLATVAYLWWKRRGP